MTIDTEPKCPKCGATVHALVEHYCKIDPDSIDAPIVVAVCERLPAAGWLPPADAARLRALLRELVAEMEEYVKPKVVIEMYDRELVTTASVARCRELVARARAEVGGGE